MTSGKGLGKQNFETAQEVVDGDGGPAPGGEEEDSLFPPNTGGLTRQGHQL